MDLERPCPVGSSGEGFGRRGSVFPDALGMIAAEPFFGPGPRTTTRAAGGRFRAIAGRDSTERSFMRFERRYPAAAGFSLPHPRRSRTNSPSESSWTWTRPPLRRRTRLPTPRLPCRRFSAGAAFSLTNMSGKNLPPFGGGGFRSRRGGLSETGFLLDAKGACGLLPAAPGSGGTCDRRETPWRYGLVIFSEEEKNFKR